MAGEANFIWDLISDVWDDYEDRDRISSLWEGYLQIGSDLVLQLIQANLSKSIIDIPVFRRYRWKNYVLDRTSKPTSYTSSNLFSYNAGDVDILSIPTLRDMVRDPSGFDYVHVANSNTGLFQNGSQLCDFSNPFPGGLRVGDYVRVLEGNGLAEADTDKRFQIIRLDDPTCVTLDARDLTDATELKYMVERAPFVSLVQGVHFTTSRGVINFCPAPVTTQDGTETAFRAVETLEWSGDFVRDDPRLIADGGNGVTNGVGDITLDSPVLTDASALFLTNPTVAERPVAGDYVVLRPSGVQPSQTLTTQLVFKVSNVISDTELSFDGRSPTTTVQVSYDILKPSAEDFDLISTEDGIDGYTLGYAFRTVAAAAPSGTSGEFLANPAPPNDVNRFQDTTKDFTGLIGKKLRVLSVGSGPTPDELAEFTILALDGTDTVVLDRAVSAVSTTTDAVYVVGDVVAVDTIDTRPSTGLIFPDAFQFQQEDSNTSSVTDGAIFFNKDLVPAAGPLIKMLRDRSTTTNTREAIVNQLWAEETISDQQALYENFGFPIQVQQGNSEEFKNVLQGLWYAYWNGPSLDNIVRGLNLVFDLPFAPMDGVISDISLPDPAELIGTVSSSLNAPPFTFDTSAANPFGDSRFLSFSVDSQPPVLVVFPDTPDTPAGPGPGSVIDLINTAVGAPVASLTAAGNVRLSALTSVKIDTVIGNPGLGFEPGNEDFGTFNVTLVFEDGSTELLEFGTQFPLAVEVGDAVEQFQQLTTAVGVFDYISLPGWWNIFGISQIQSGITTFSQEDKDILNDIAKDFTFAVRVVADAFTRLGTVDRDIIRFFLEQIKPTISDYLFIVAESFYDIISVTDDRALLGEPSSPEYRQQHGGVGSRTNLTIGLQNVRSINWNFANYNQLTPAERILFEANYHQPQYDDLRLTTEDVTVISPIQADVLSGTGPTSYKVAAVNGTISADHFPTTEALVLRWGGFVPFIIQAATFQAASAGNTPIHTMTLSQAVAFVNNEWATIYAGSFLNDTLMWLNPDGTLRLQIDRRDGGVVRLEVLQAHIGFGFPVADVTGVPTSGLIRSVQSS